MDATLFVTPCLQLDRFCLQKVLWMAELKRCVYVNSMTRAGPAIRLFPYRWRDRLSGIRPYNTPHCCPASWVCLSCVCECVYFALLLFSFPQGYQDHELHSWQIFPTCDGQLCVIIFFLNAMHSSNVFRVFCILCILHENSRWCCRRCGTRVEVLRAVNCMVIQVGKNIIAVINKLLSSASLMVFP